MGPPIEPFVSGSDEPPSVSGPRIGNPVEMIPDALRSLPPNPSATYALTAVAVVAAIVLAILASTVAGDAERVVLGAFALALFVMFCWRLERRGGNARDAVKLPESLAPPMSAQEYMANVNDRLRED